MYTLSLHIWECLSGHRFFEVWGVLALFLPLPAPGGMLKAGPQGNLMISSPCCPVDMLLASWSFMGQRLLSHFRRVPLLSPHEKFWRFSAHGAYATLLYQFAFLCIGWVRRFLLQGWVPRVTGVRGGGGGGWERRPGRKKGKTKKILFSPPPPPPGVCLSACSL